MKTFIATLALLAAGLLTAAAQTGTTQNNDTKMNTIKLTIEGGRTFTATLADNPSAKALARLLEQGALTIRMEDYANMEKVGPIGSSLPRNDRHINTSAGDIILYQGRYLVIYYDTNSWSLTRLGRIEGASAEELRSALGSGDVSVTLTLDK